MVHQSVCQGLIFLACSQMQRHVTFCQQSSELRVVLHSLGTLSRVWRSRETILIQVKLGHYTLLYHFKTQTESQFCSKLKEWGSSGRLVFYLLNLTCVEVKHVLLLNSTH